MGVNPLGIPIFFSMMVLCSSVFAEEKPSASIPKVSQDPRLGSLISRYGRFPYAAPKIAVEGELPASLRLMVKSGQTDLLDELGKTCRILLFQQAATYDLPIDLFGDYPANPPAEQLRDVLDTTWDYLRMTQGVIADLNSFLDWYSGDDWERRFGGAGFYQRLRQFDRDVRFWMAVYWYYQGRIGQLPSENGTPSGTRDERIKNLKESFETVKQYLADSNQKPDGLSFLKLWSIRLGRVLAEYEPTYYETVRRQLELVLKSPLEPERQYGFRLESLRCALSAPAIRASELGTLILQVHQFRGWLELNQYSILQSKKKFLELAFLESVLHQKRRTLTASVPRLRERAYLSNRTYLKPLIDLAEREAEFTSLIQEIIAARLAASVQALEKNQEKDWARHIRNGTEFELLSLARYYRNQSPPEFAKAQQVYEIIIQTRTNGHDKMAEVLYDAALCCYQQAQPDENHHGKAEDRRHLVQAISYWNRLARTFPRWSGTTDPQTVNAYQAAVRSAAWAYRLSNEFPVQYAELARETVAILVGSISSVGAEPTGPFAATPAARQYRYYYALVLFSLADYDRAADWFAAVPREDPRRQAARYYAIHCRYQQTRMDGQNRDESLRQYKSWIAELEILLQEKLSETVGNQVVNLLIQLYQEMNQTDGVLHAVAQTLQKNRNQPQWITLALKIFQEQKSILLQLHAEAKYVALSNKLAQALPAAQIVYDILQSESAESIPSLAQQKLPATRNYLEQFCLAAVTVSDYRETHSLPPLRQLISQADTAISSVRNDPSCANQVWFVRCRAQMAFVQMEFEQSRQYWHQIRSAVAEKNDEHSKYFWWESRYFSLRCLMQLNRTEEAEHVIDVLLRSHPNETTPWMARFMNLQTEPKATSKKTTVP